MSWLVYRLTHSGLMLGIVGFSSQIPTFLVTPFAGVWVDRWNRHRVLVWTQILSTVQAFLLAFFVLRSMITIVELIALSAFLGVINAFDIPARQAFVIDMVEDRADLPNAIAINSSMVNAARLIGPSIAGIVIAVLGEGMCFLLNAISFFAVIVALLAMRVNKEPPLQAPRSVLESLKEGFFYAYSSIPIRTTLMLLALVSLTGMSYMTLLPIVATDVLHGGPRTLGFLTAASGTGAILGTIYLASFTAKQGVSGLEKLIGIACGACGLGLVAFGFSHLFWVSMFFLFLVGMASMLQMAASNMSIQSQVDDDKRGRVMSFFAMAFMGMAPFGSLIGGALSGKIGAPATLASTGGVCFFGALIFMRISKRAAREVV